MPDFSLYAEPPNDGDDYLIPMFSVPLLHLKVQNWQEKKKSLIEIYNSRKSQESVFKVANEIFYDVETDYHHNYDNEEGYEEEIANILLDELEVLADTFECSVEVSTTWFERATKNKYHAVHNHGICGFSAVCFINFNPEKHTPTSFLNPILCDESQMSFQPGGISEGSLIFFPSYVLHHTEPNNSDEERIILSFNIQANYFSPKFSEME